MKDFKAKPKHLLPILVVLAASTLLASILSEAYGMPPLMVTPFTEAGTGPVMNALYFVAVIAVAGTVVYLFLKVRLVRTLKFFTSVIYALVAITLTTVYLPACLWLAGLGELNASIPLIVVLYVTFVLFTLYAVFIDKKTLHALSMLFVASALGALLGFVIPTFSAVAILLGLAAYDVFSVFKGPIGKMASMLEDESLGSFVLSYGNLKIGLGDLVFYSMLTAHVLIFLGIFPFIASVVGVLVGVYVSLKMLEGKKIFPGLPFALILGIALCFLTYYLFPNPIYL